VTLGLPLLLSGDENTPFYAAGPGRAKRKARDDAPAAGPPFCLRRLGTGSTIPVAYACERAVFPGRGGGRFLRPRLTT